MRHRTSRFAILAWACMAWTLGTTTPVIADGCDDCKAECKRGEDKCRNAVPKGWCKFGRGICPLFKNGQCRAAEKICRDTRCGLLPGCDPSPGGVASGEPHLLTFDRLRYDFQGIGEFVLARAKAGPEIQVRLRKFNTNTSIVSAAGVRHRDHVIAFVHGRGVMVDGKPVEIAPSGLSVDDVAIHPYGKNSYLVSAGPATVRVLFASKFLNVRVEPDPVSAGSWEGLFGDFDGKPENDFRTRGGEVFARANVTKEILYGTFGDSWRLQKAESFLPADGGSSDPVADRDFPPSVFSIADLDEAAYAAAHAACVAKGVTAGDTLRDCIYDVGATGDASFAESYVGVPFAQAAQALSLGGKLAVRVQRKAGQGEHVPVFWSGRNADDGTIEVLSTAGRRLSWRATQGENPVLVQLPAAPGAYAVRYTDGDATTSQPIEVVEVQATLAAPDSVVGAEEFEVSWTGPGGKADYVALMKGGETSPQKHLALAWAPRGKTTFQAPATPGTYELWYVRQGQPGHVALARRDLVVTAARATMKAPATAEAGSFIPITWTGPNGKGDIVDIVDAAHTTPTGSLSYEWTKKGNALEVRAPLDAGRYLVRYVATTSAGRAILVTQAIEVTEATAALEAPPTATAGTKVEVSWTGPNRQGDYVAIAESKDKPAGAHLVYVWAKPGKGAIKVPSKPGTYELRYVLQGSGTRKVIARKPLVVKPD